MRLFVTGARGFIGGAVVRDAVGRGHEVVALVRSPSGADAPSGTGPVREVVGDVRLPEQWEHALEGCDAVVHLAAAFGEPVEQWDVLVHGTQQLVAAMGRRGPDRLVLASSMAVYDYAALEPGALVDEGTPLEAEPARRDTYAAAKLAQEAIAAERDELRTTILRPGAVYGPSHLWRAGLALRVPFGLGLDIAPGGQLKLCFVDSASLALVLAAEQDAAVGAVVNVVDDALPTPAAFGEALRRNGLDAPRSVKVPYALVEGFARLASGIDRRLLGGRLPLPELAVPPRLAARYKPLRYTNQAAKRALGWSPPFSLDEALARTAAGGG